MGVHVCASTKLHPLDDDHTLHIFMGHWAIFTNVHIHHHNKYYRLDSLTDVNIHLHQIIQQVYSFHPLVSTFRFLSTFLIFTLITLILTWCSAAALMTFMALSLLSCVIIISKTCLSFPCRGPHSNYARLTKPFPATSTADKVFVRLRVTLPRDKRSLPTARSLVFMSSERERGREGEGRKE